MLSDGAIVAIDLPICSTDSLFDFLIVLPDFSIVVVDRAALLLFKLAKFASNLRWADPSGHRLFFLGVIKDVECHQELLGIVFSNLPHTIRGDEKCPID